jgi:hypothetical protein
MKARRDREGDWVSREEQRVREEEGEGWEGGQR